MSLHELAINIVQLLSGSLWLYATIKAVRTTGGFLSIWCIWAIVGLNAWIAVTMYTVTGGR